MTANRFGLLAILTLAWYSMSEVRGAPGPTVRQACENKCRLDFALSTRGRSSEKECCDANGGSWSFLGCFISNESKHGSFRACQRNLNEAKEVLASCMNKCRGRQLNIGVITLAE